MRSLAVSFLGLCLCLAGCTSTLSERMADVPPQVREYNGSVEQVYSAAQKAFKRVDFNVTRSAMGRVEAASSIHTSDTFADSRQITARLAIHELEAGKVEVEMWVTQEVASSSLGGTHRTPMRDHSFFGLYFAMLQQVLVEQGIAQPAPKS